MCIATHLCASSNAAVPLILQAIIRFVDVKLLLLENI